MDREATAVPRPLISGGAAGVDSPSGAYVQHRGGRDRQGSGPSDMARVSGILGFAGHSVVLEDLPCLGHHFWLVVHELTRHLRL